jgi:hypothetical protein
MTASYGYPEWLQAIDQPHHHKLRINSSSNFDFLELQMYSNLHKCSNIIVKYIQITVLLSILVMNERLFKQRV